MEPGVGSFKLFLSKDEARGALGHSSMPSEVNWHWVPAHIGSTHPVLTQEKQCPLQLVWLQLPQCWRLAQLSGGIFFPLAGAVAPSGTQKGTRAVVIRTTTSALEQDTVSGQTLKLLLRRSLTDFSVTFVFCNSFSWVAVGAISAPIPMPFNFFFSKLLPLEVENKPWALVSCIKAKCQSASACGHLCWCQSF